MIHVRVLHTSLPRSGACARLDRDVPPRVLSSLLSPWQPASAPQTLRWRLVAGCVVRGRGQSGTWEGGSMRASKLEHGQGMHEIGDGERERASSVGGMRWMRWMRFGRGRPPSSSQPPCFSRRRLQPLWLAWCARPVLWVGGFKDGMMGPRFEKRERSRGR